MDGQGAAAGENIGADGGHGLIDPDLLQSAAVPEGPVADGGQTGRQEDGPQLVAALEGKGGQGGDALRDFELLQAGAACEEGAAVVVGIGVIGPGTGAGGQGFGVVGAGQLDAAVEYPEAHGLDGVGQHNGGQAGAAVKGVVADFRQTFRQGTAVTPAQPLKAYSPMVLVPVPTVMLRMPLQPSKA